MRVAIYEPGWHGHRLHYVRLIADAALADGHEVTLVTSGPATESPEFDVHLGSLDGSIAVDATSSSAEDGHGTWAMRGLRHVRDLARSGTVDWILVPNADHIAQAAAAITRPRTWPVPVEGLLLRSRFAYPTQRQRDHLLAAASRRAVVRTPWRRMMLLDPLGHEALPPSATVDLMPEPVEETERIDRSEARQMLDLPTEASPLFVMPGMIDARKGAIEAVEAFRLADLPESAVLAFVGRVSPEVVGALGAAAAADERVVVIDRTVSDDEFRGALSAADVLLATYRRHVGPSGIVVRAASLGIPLVASDYGWVGEATRRYELGTTVASLEALVLAAALEKSARSLPWDTRTAVSAPYRAFNTVAGFQDTWMSGIRGAVA